MPTSTDIQVEDEHLEDTAVLYSDGQVHPIDPSHRLDIFFKFIHVLINSFFYHIDTIIKYKYTIMHQILYRDVKSRLLKITIVKIGVYQKSSMKTK